MVIGKCGTFFPNDTFWAERCARENGDRMRLAARGIFSFRLLRYLFVDVPV